MPPTVFSNPRRAIKMCGPLYSQGGTIARVHETRFCPVLQSLEGFFCVGCSRRRGCYCGKYHSATVVGLLFSHKIFVKGIGLVCGQKQDYYKRNLGWKKIYLANKPKGGHIDPWP